MSKTRFWIGVAAKEHVDIAVRERFCMFAHGKGSAAKQLSQGDWFAYYSPKTGMKSGKEVRAFTALGCVDDDTLTERPMGEHGVGIMRSATYHATGHADIYSLLDAFSFVKKRSHWGMYFRKSLFEIPQDDMLLIARAMGIDPAKVV